jgi:outer membrane protein OmpA-like peptidoglycan-associated protein
VPRHLTYEVGLALNYAHAPLVFERPGAGNEDVVGWRAQGEVLAALGLFEWMELGVAVPVTVASVAKSPEQGDFESETITRAGDVRLSLKVPVLRGDFSLAGKMVVGLPSGDGDRLLGDGYWTSTPGVVAAYELGRVTFSGELSYRLRRRAVLGNPRAGGLEYDDELHLAGGVTVEVLDSLSAIAETQFRAGVGGRTVNSNEMPMEADLGLRWQPAGGWTVEVGGGTGLHSGYGTPAARAFASVRWASEREPCDAGPEDFDGYQDGDFCADPDNDADGVPDTEDDCRNDPEDPDGFLDGDGCPDRDNDADGVLDGEDECPLESEDRDGWKDLDGCPDLDNDEDGIEDGVDQCPMEPEDADQYQDADGCPEPGPDKATVTVTDTRILISDRIYFDFDQDTIRSVSKPLLDRVAKVIRELPRHRKIRVEGYTDSHGNDEYNRDLSYRRARAVVEYLASQGVSRRRLEYKGYGEQNPVAPNDTAEGRALNRRVEFTIMDRRGGSR